QLAEQDEKVNGLATQLAERNEAVNEFNVKLAEQHKAVKGLTTQLAERDEKVNGLSTQLTERDATVEGLSTQLAEQDEKVNGLNAQLAERDEKVNGLATQLAERNEAVNELNVKLAEQHKAVKGLSTKLAQRDEKVNGLSTQLTERDATVEGLTAQLAKRDEKVNGFTTQLAERDGQLVALHEAVAASDHQITVLHGSKSWRITKPLRFVSRLLIRTRKEQNTFRSISLKESAVLLEKTDQEVVLDKDKLPNGFDPDVYVKLNPDLAVAGVDPTTHYLRHGRYEGRIFSVLDKDFCADYDFKGDQETILVVSHEATRTGAPVLSFNLVQELGKRYNIVVLLLGGGPLSSAFRRAGAKVLISINLMGNAAWARVLVGQLCERFNLKFALVNSIEARLVLPTLGEYFVPAISLLHEFASYTHRPRQTFKELFFWSGEVVFSTKLTLENALAECPDLRDLSARILPQGRCLLPMEEFSEVQLQAERARIRRLIRPEGVADNSVVVLGAGFVHLRKGVDLFIECAARVVHAQEGKGCRFVWIGKGYDPENDFGYSVYLADQIRRAGLDGHVLFLDETVAIEAAYEEADLFLLSSRLDPLPNVAIDAMAHGVPALCFNKTTGIADFLMDSGLGNHCVAAYLDSADLAEKILTLAGSQVLREHVGGRCREASIAYFNRKDYVARLEILARGVCDRTQQEKMDKQAILDAGLFRQDFSHPPFWQEQSIDEEVRAYVRGWASGIDRRKPFPGFHPGIYLEQHGVATQGADPFADYLRAERPDGPWHYPVIIVGKTKEKDLPDNQRVALHLHVYYPELLPEITVRLAHNKICPDLFVSVTNEEACDFVVSELKDYKGRVVDIQLVPNRGRDIGPFLKVFGQRIIDAYDFVGHIHTKKTADVKDVNVGKTWYRFLLKNLLGGESEAMADSILAAMKHDASMGMVFPDDPYIVGWGANRDFAESHAVRLDLQNTPENLNFPVGTMFWARTSVLVPLLDLKLDWEDYPEEPLPYDGTLLHAMERLLPLIVSAGNWQNAVTNVIGVTR
ncbi:MAG: hypothetical protein BA863_19105, partial [Desulfovibrio sp. S3730MH75]